MEYKFEKRPSTNPSQEKVQNKPKKETGLSIEELIGTPTMPIGTGFKMGVDTVFFLLSICVSNPKNYKNIIFSPSGHKNI